MSDHDNKEEKTSPPPQPLPPPPKTPEKGMVITDTAKLPPVPPKTPEKAMIAIGSNVFGDQEPTLRATGALLRPKEDE